MTPAEQERLWKAQRMIKSKCPKCGYKVFTEPRGYGICRWCGTKVISQKMKFKKKMKKMLENREAI